MWAAMRDKQPTKTLYDALFHASECLHVASQQPHHKRELESVIQAAHSALENANADRIDINRCYGWPPWQRTPMLILCVRIDMMSAANVNLFTPILLKKFSDSVDFNAADGELGRTALHNICDYLMTAQARQHTFARSVRLATALCQHSELNVNITNGSGCTPIQELSLAHRRPDHFTEQWQSAALQLIRIIGSHKSCNINALSSSLSERSALHFLLSAAPYDISANYRRDAVNALLRLGADPDQTYVQHFHLHSNLILAVHQQDPEIIRSLLEHRANPNLQDEEGRTALHHAVSIAIETPHHSPPQFFTAKEALSTVLQYGLPRGLDLSLLNAHGKSAENLAVDPHPGAFSPLRKQVRGVIKGCKDVFFSDVERVRQCLQVHLLPELCGITLDYFAGKNAVPRSRRRQNV